MRAAFLEAKGRLVLTDVAMPTIDGPDQMLIQVKTVGICGSEVHAYEGTHPSRIAPVILGHEPAGVVAEVGPAVTRFRPGDRVIVDPQWPCGQCAYCRAGDINLCTNKRVLGTPAWPGAFGEYIVAPEEGVFALPDHLPFAQGSLIEPLTIGVHVARRAELAAGESVAILGSGSIGGMVSGVARVRGADPIITADIRQHCLDAARERMGSTHDFLLPDDQVVDKVRKLGGGEGVDTAFVTGDDPALVGQAIQMVKRRGKVVLVALLTASPVQLRAYDIIGRERQVLGSTMGNHEDCRQAIELAASGQVDVEGILTHVLPFEEAQRGMDLARTKDDGAIKVILSFER
jgi:2-desacetyl-2-hydroxyethyl bacteriochlorophyllide A dehydrogenase